MNRHERLKSMVREDSGQRFQYTGKRADGTEMVWGWSDEFNGWFTEKILKHPDFIIAEVFDRQKASES